MYTNRAEGAVAFVRGHIAKCVRVGHGIRRTVNLRGKLASDVPAPKSLGRVPLQLPERGE